MRKFLLLLLIAASNSASGQNVQGRLVVNAASTSTTTVADFEVRTSAGTQLWVGLTFNFLFQNGNLLPQSTGLNTAVGVDDALMRLTYGWGQGNRFTNPFQDLTGTPITINGQTYSRRYIYGNSDETGTNTQTLTTTWVKILSITFNNQSGTYPQGGYGYMQETSQNINVALTDDAGFNIPIDVLSGSTALNPPIVTPVLFTKYDVQCTDKGTLLTWATATEQNSSKFEIQRSKNGTDWIVIDKVAAAGNSTTDRNYQYSDLHDGAAFYRIRQVDLDGKYVYTAIKHIVCESKDFSFIIYPVPAKENLTIVIKSNKSIAVDLRITDINGRLVRRIPVQINSGNNNISIDVKNLSIGQYLLTSSHPDIQINKKFVVAR